MKNRSSPFNLNTILLMIFVIFIIVFSFHSRSNAAVKSNVTFNPIGKHPPGPTTGWSEQQLRDYFSLYGFDVNKAACNGNGNSCTDLYGLGSYAVTGAPHLATAIYDDTGTYPNLIISGGTESGHITHGEGEPVLDIAPNSALNQYIKDNSVFVRDTQNGPLYQIGDNYFLQEGDHWHVVFGPSNGTNVDNISIGDFSSTASDNTNTSNSFNDYYSPSIPDNFTFDTNLQYGSQGESVRYLQEFLNSQDPATCPGCQVAVSGPGSPGNETTYFGSDTETALKNFQAANANDTLYPWGLTEPTGVAGPTTRDEMNALLAYQQSEKDNGLSTNQSSQTSQPSADTLPPPAPPIPSTPPTSGSGQTSTQGNTNNPNAGPAVAPGVAVSGTIKGIAIKYQCNPTASQVTNRFDCPGPTNYGLTERSTKGPCPITGAGTGNAGKYQWVCGTLSFFGGSTDTSYRKDDSLAGISSDYGPSFKGLQPYSQDYSAMRWNYSKISKDQLRTMYLQLYRPGGANGCVNTVIVDWGPRPEGVSANISFDISNQVGRELHVGAGATIYGRLIPRAGNKRGLTDTCFR